MHCAPPPFHRHGAQDRKSRARPEAGFRDCLTTSVQGNKCIIISIICGPDPCTPPSKKGVRDAITRRSGLKNYERSVHRVQSRSTQSSMHSLAHVYRLLPQPVSKASTPSAHLRNGSVQRAAPRTCTMRAHREGGMHLDCPPTATISETTFHCTDSQPWCEGFRRARIQSRGSMLVAALACNLHKGGL